MPRNPRPKTFVAVRDFRIVGEGCFATGDPVTGRALRIALGHGDKFVTDKPPTTTQADQAATEGD